MVIASQLAKYIVHHTNYCEVEEFVQVQREHYGRVYGDADILRQWLRMTRDQLRTSSQDAVRLPWAVWRNSNFLLPIRGTNERGWL